MRNILNEKLLDETFKQLPKETQKELIEVLQRTLLAIKINKDEEFVLDAVSDMCEKYPILRDILIKGKYNQSR